MSTSIIAMDMSSQNSELIYDITNDNYLKFVDKLRDAAKDPDRLCHGLSVLPLKTDADPPNIFVNLQKNGDFKGVALVRRYDLRLINFQDMSGNVVSVDDFKIYDFDSTLNDFGIDGFILGLPTFVDAIDFLVHHCKMKNTDDKQLTNLKQSLCVRTSLAVLCLVLCEATKINFLACLLANAFKSGFKVRLNKWLLHRVNDWKFFSEELHSDYHSDTAECNAYVPFSNNDWHDGRRAVGVTCQDIVKFLGIVKAFLPWRDLPEDPPLGDNLLIVFSVRVYINGRRSGNVYGSIKIDNGYDTYHIYDRHPPKCQYVESHGTLSLLETDSIVAGTKIDMMVDIMEAGGDNLEISKGKLSWEPIPHIPSYDSLISSMVRGKNGYVIVYYSIFKNAVLGYIEVKLARKGYHEDDIRHICVHGSLTAHFDFECGADYCKKNYFVATLFDKPYVCKELPVATSTFKACERGTYVRDEAPLELVRSKFPAKVMATVKIVADLRCCNGKPIVRGAALCEPDRRLCDSRGLIIGDLVDPEDSHVLAVGIKWRKMDLGCMSTSI